MTGKKNEKETGADGVIAQNRKARHDYQILESVECGIALRGTEVKSCRMRSVSMQDSFAKAERNQIFVYNLNISPYSHGNIFNHTPVRPRVLLLQAGWTAVLIGLGCLFWRRNQRRLVLQGG